MKQLYPTVQNELEPLAIYDELEFPEANGTLPYVALNMVSSIDGKITFNRNERRAPIGSPVDRTLMGRLRVHFDAVLRGAETVRKNPYIPTVPDEGATKRVEKGLEEQPYAVVLSESLDLPWRSAFFYRSERVIVLTSHGADPEKLETAREKAIVETVGEDGVDLPQAFKLLKEKYGVQHLLAEGGGGLNYHLFRSGLINEIFWTLAPRVSGLEDDLTMVYGPEMITPPPKLTLESLYFHEGELFHRWSIPTSEGE